MLSREIFSLVPNLPQVNPVVQDFVEPLLAHGFAVFTFGALGNKLLDDQSGGMRFDEGLEYPPNHLRILWYDHQLSLVNPVAQRDRPAHPHALAFRGGNFVPDPLAGHLTLELGKGQQHVEHQTPHGGGRVDLLRHGAETHFVFVKNLHHLGKVGQGP